MRSRNPGGESSSSGHFSRSKPMMNKTENSNLQEDAKKRSKCNQKGEQITLTGTAKQHSRLSVPGEKKSKKSIELSKEDLIQLLSIMEGELQVSQKCSAVWFDVRENC